MTVDVIVPYNPNGCPHRTRAWEWVRSQYRNAHPDWKVIEGTVAGPWSKASAVADALTRSAADLLVLADADVWTPTVGDAVNAVTVGAALWAMPHRRVVRFTERATARVVDGVEPAAIAAEPGTLTERPYRGQVGGGIVVMSRAVYEQVPLDPRFVGWGGEDAAWAFALVTLAGRRAQARNVLWHLFHPPQARMNRAVGNADNEQLRTRYREAAGDVTAMRELIAEGRACLSNNSLPARVACPQPS